MSERPNDTDTERLDLQVQATNRLIEALAASEQTMRRRIELISDVVFELDQYERIVFVNRAWATVVGGTPEMALGERFADYLAEPADWHIGEVLAADPSAARSARALKRADGALAWVEISLTSLGPSGYLGTLHDVTRQRAYQKELEQLSLVANNTDNFVIIADADGNCEWVNPAFTARTGFTLDEMLGKRPGCILQGPDTDPRAIAHISAALRERRSVSAEILNYTKRHEPYWTMLHINPILGNDGALQRFVSVQTETTRLRAIQSELETAKAVAEAASRDKSLLLANVSHELRTPMTGVLGIADMLLATDLAPQQRRYVEVMQSSGNLLLRIINDVLEFSRIEEGRIEIEQKPFELAAAIAGVADILAPMFREKGLVFDIRLPPEGLPRLVGDAARFQQILYNILGNALKFTQVGSVTLAVDCVPTASGSTNVLVWVRDTGGGIAPTKIESIFRPFEQADKSVAQRFGGSGLGLWICKRLVERMGGEISAASVPDRGSEFFFSLPLLSAGPGPASEGAPAGLHAAAPTLDILLADDSDVNRMVIRSVLEKEGHRVVEVLDGAQALERVQTAAFDVVLMDIQMPVMDGLTAAVRIRELGGALARVPIFALTADIVSERRDAYLNGGFDKVLAKPIDWAMLKQALRAVPPGLGRPPTV
ncbi:MAG: response regulator [Telmatospirillum sp.]|nr:response regulator [Telmatospirillum sp.]